MAYVSTLGRRVLKGEMHRLAWFKGGVEVRGEDPADARVGAVDLIPLPGGQGTGVEPEPAGKLPLGESRCLAGGPDAATKGRGRRPGVVAQEAEDRGQEAQLRLCPALLPIEEGCLRAADLLRDVLLPQAAIKPHPPEVVAEVRGSAGNPGLLFCPRRVTWQLVHEPLGVLPE